ncbi:restriction endonuclease [Mariprofundus ferrooxydans]|uniref:restriction endonuclease n=1 Tax=Mariprofundus ferrooxydans TaxID=314344 RepID=UPI0003716B37|nr:restriction endonuclease [Mariprofundus ferrooxydans]
MKDRRKPEVYERCVAAWAIEHFDFIDITVTANAKIRGVISNRSRQIDVLLEDRFKGNPEARVIVEVKLHGRPVDIEVIEAVEAKIRDVNAGDSVIVSSGGFTSSAIRRSEENVKLTLLDYNKLVDEYSDAYDNCFANNDCGQEVLWSVDKLDEVGPGWLMYKYGKCIRCHTFHVLCQDCGSVFPIPDGSTVTCGCDDKEWGAIPESETSGHTGTPESTWLMLKLDGEYYGLQRKPIGKVASQI